MKIVHFADLHLGIDNYGTFDPETGLSKRVGDFLDALDAIVDHAIEGQADIVLFAGDAFKNRDPNPTLQREFARRIARLSTAGIPLVILIGNHDQPGLVSRAAAAEIYEVLAIPNVYVAREVDTLRIDTRSGLLQIVTVPWLSKSHALESEAARALGSSDFQEQMAAGMRLMILNQTQTLDPSLPAVLLGHLTIEGAQVGFERHIMLGADVEVTTETLEASRFDYVALGHIHKHQELRARPPVVYAGSPERVDFGEESEDKGFVEVEIVGEGEGRRTRWRFIKLPARRFLTLRIDAQSEDPWADVDSELTNRAPDIRDAVVRCFVKVSREHEARLSAQEIRRRLTELGAFSIGTVVVESDAVDRPRLEVDVDAAMDPLTMLDRWMELRDVPEQQRDRYRKLARLAIQRHRETSQT